MDAHSFCYRGRKIPSRHQSFCDAACRLETQKMALLPPGSYSIIRWTTTKASPYIIKKDKHSVGYTRIISRTTCTVTLGWNVVEIFIDVAGMKIEMMSQEQKGRRIKCRISKYVCLLKGLVVLRQLVTCDSACTISEDQWVESHDWVFLHRGQKSIGRSANWYLFYPTFCSDWLNLINRLCPPKLKGSILE